MKKSTKKENKTESDECCGLIIGILSLVIFSIIGYYAYETFKYPNENQCFSSNSGGRVAQINRIWSDIDVIQVDTVNFFISEKERIDLTYEEFNDLYPVEVPCSVYQLGNNTVDNYMRFTSLREKFREIEDKVDKK